MEDVLFAALGRTLHRAKLVPGAHDAIRGVELINKVIRVDQQPLGQTPTSNPATFTGTFDLIRALYAQLPEAKLRGYTPRRFSFNASGGRCEKCEGNGQLRIEMHFLPDVWVECDACGGRRYNPETLAVRYHGRSIADVLDMSCGEAVKLFENIPKIRRPLEMLCDVGLDYLTLGQPAPTLSGGEAQRVKLAAELARPDTGRTLYLLDEPTTGLHFDDLSKLLDVLNRLVDLGNTVVVIEHNLDVIKTADWVIDLGPEAGDEGGYVVAAGTPEEIVRRGARETRGERKGREESGEETAEGGSPSPLVPRPSPLVSHTAAALAPVLAAGPFARARFTISPPNWPRGRVIATSSRSAVTPACPGKSTVRGGTRSIASAAPAIRAGGTAASWPRSSTASRSSPSCLPRPIGTRASVVEIRAAKKSDGWFFHAITGEEWLLKMKFRTAKNTFRREELVEKLDLKPLNDMPDVPLYGTEPRVRCKNFRGPWQEVELRVHSHEEIDRPAFWQFVDRAVAGFGKFTEKVQSQSDILQPWKQLGRTWHFARKGFALGKKIHWDVEVLEDLTEMLAEIAPQGQFLWNNKQVVPHLRDRATRAVGGRANQEARRRVSAPFGSEGPLHPGPDHRPGLQSRTGWAAVEGGRHSAQVPHMRPISPAAACGGFLKEHLAVVGGSSR